MKKLPLEYQMVTETYLKPMYLPTYETEVTVLRVTGVKIVTLVTKKLFSPNTFFHLKNFFQQPPFFTNKNNFHLNSMYDKTQKLQMGQNTKKLQMWQNSECDKTQELQIKKK